MMYLSIPYIKRRRHKRKMINSIDELTFIDFGIITETSNLSSLLLNIGYDPIKLESVKTRLAMESDYNFPLYLFNYQIWLKDTIKQFNKLY